MIARCLRWVGVSLVAGLALAWAESPPTGPLALVALTVESVVADMHTHAERYQADPGALEDMVRERVAPHFDHQRMTQLVLGGHWSSASPDQRRRASEAFRELMVRTYARALFEFRGSPVTVLGQQPSRPDRTQVRMRVTAQNGSPADVILRMELRQDQWRVVDVVVDGVSLVVTYRGSFGETISRSGLEGLIDSLNQGSGSATQ